MFFKKGSIGYIHFSKVQISVINVLPVLDMRQEFGTFYRQIFTVYYS